MMLVVAVFAVACNQQKDDWTHMGTIRVYDASEDFDEYNRDLYVKNVGGERMYQLREVGTTYAVTNNPYYGKKSEYGRTSFYSHRAGHYYFNL